MTLWVDAQLPPRIARWLREEFSVEAIAVRELDLRNALDSNMVQSVRGQSIAIMTRDAELVDWVKRLGPPPQILWMTCGNISEQGLREILSNHFGTALALLESGEPIVEIS